MLNKSKFKRLLSHEHKKNISLITTFSYLNDKDLGLGDMAKNNIMFYVTISV